MVTKIVGVVVFLIGVIIAALGLTVVSSSGLLLAGILLGGAGFVTMYLALKSGKNVLIKIIGAVVLLIGVIIAALGLTVVSSSELLLAGIIAGAVGYVILYLA